MSDSDDQWYVSMGDGKSLGPHRLEVLVQMAKQQPLPEDATVFHQAKTKGEWISANRIKPIAELKTQSVVPTPPPVSPPKIVDDPASKVTASCPHCRVDLLIHRSQAGMIIDCPKCSGKFQAPIPSALRPGNAGITGIIGPSPPLQMSREEFIAKKIPAGVCGIMFGGLGVHKFILGLQTPAVIVLSGNLLCFLGGVCLVFPILGCFVFYVIGVIEGIMYLSKTDEQFYQIYGVERREWF